MLAAVTFAGRVLVAYATLSLLRAEGTHVAACWRRRRGAVLAGSAGGVTVFADPAAARLPLLHHALALVRAQLPGREVAIVVADPRDRIADGASIIANCADARLRLILLRGAFRVEERAP